MTIIATTTENLANQMILNHCGDYAGKYQDEAYEIFQEKWDSEINSWDGKQWMDIMYDRDKNVYAIWAEDSLTCFNAWCYYIELDEDDCPAAFKEMNELFEN
ncbi:MAG: hypothetical protein N4A59_06175 [Marinifilum sp.]|jgi:hypothetical protein|nr:hypothetical protein [Marinifilum sp.]